MNLHAPLVNPVGTSAACESDRLFRSLYLRREYTMIHRCREKEGENGVPEGVVIVPPPFSSVDYLAKEFGIRVQQTDLSATASPRGSLISFPAQAAALESEFSRPQAELSTLEWSGWVYVVDTNSPWVNGCFPFTVHFPDKYPFEPPLLQMIHNFSSHPLMKKCRRNSRVSPEGHQETSHFPDPELRSALPFDAIYATIDPLHSSVMAQIFLFVNAIFLPDCWTPKFLSLISDGEFALRDDVLHVVDREAAQRDVERCSILRNVSLGKSYVDYLCHSAAPQFLEVFKNKEKGEDARMAEWVTWCGREAIPTILKLP